MTRPHPSPAPDSAPLEERPSAPDDLRSHLTPPARDWLDRALTEATHPGPHGTSPAWESRLAEAGRRCGSAHADTARVLILHAARPTPADLARVYHRGTADERRAVLHALPGLVPGPDGLPSSRTPCAPTTPGSSQPPSVRTPPATWNRTCGGTRS